MEIPNVPKIENLQEITPEKMREYVSYVATMRMYQNKWFNAHDVGALNVARSMERELDKLNAYLLDPAPRLF